MAMASISASALNWNDLIKNEDVWFMTGATTMKDGREVKMDLTTMAIMTFSTERENGTKVSYLTLSWQKGASLKYRVVPDGDTLYATGVKIDNEEYQQYDTPSTIRLYVITKRKIKITWSDFKQSMYFERLD